MGTILADIGGTNVRFALASDEGIQNPIKYKCADYDGFVSVMQHYLDETSQKADTVLPACAAWPNENGIYTFSNKSGWDFSPQEIRDAGYALSCVLNDFEASSYGAMSLRADELETLKSGRHGRDYARLVCGPGTGLGFGVAAPNHKGGWSVQRSFGARMAAVTMTEEQEQVKQALFKILGGRAIVEFENMASGRGLIGLHQAVCDVYGLDRFGDRAEHVLSNQDQKSAQITLRLFHEFLGIFLHSALMFTHSYGGVYLCGGMMDRLKENNLLNWPTVEKYMLSPLGAEYVSYIIQDTPVYYMKDPYLALRGLQEYMSYEG